MSISVMCHSASCIFASFFGGGGGMEARGREGEDGRVGVRGRETCHMCPSSRVPVGAFMTKCLCTHSQNKRKH